MASGLFPRRAAFQSSYPPVPSRASDSKKGKCLWVFGSALHLTLLSKHGSTGMGPSQAAAFLMAMTSSEAGTLSRVCVESWVFAHTTVIMGREDGRVCRGRVQKCRLSGWASPDNHQSWHLGSRRIVCTGDFLNRAWGPTSVTRWAGRLGINTAGSIWGRQASCCLPFETSCSQSVIPGYVVSGLVVCPHPWLAWLPAFLPS